MRLSKEDFRALVDILYEESLELGYVLSLPEVSNTAEMFFGRIPVSESILAQGATRYRLKQPRTEREEVLDVI